MFNKSNMMGLFPVCFNKYGRNKNIMNFMLKSINNDRNVMILSALMIVSGLSITIFKDIKYNNISYSNDA